MNERSPEMLKPTLLAGALFGALAAVPYLNIVNFCTCCSMVVVAGFVASYLYSKRCREAGAEFRPGTGALVGLITGAFFALATTVVGAIFTLAIGKPEIVWFMDAMSEFVQQMPDVPPEALDRLDEAREEATSGAGALGVFDIVSGFLFWVVAGAVFSTLGGLIGGAAFKVEPRTPAPASTLPGPGGGV
jgi:hypothetical protein